MTTGLPSIETRVSLGLYGDARFRGFSLVHDLAGRIGAAGAAFLAIHGRWPSPEECAVMDDLVSTSLLSDARIWPLKAGRIIASYGRSIPAFAAMNLVMDGGVIGPGNIGEAGTLVLDVAARLGDRAVEAEAVEAEIRRRLDFGQRLPGFGAPFRPVDERVAALRTCMERRQRTADFHWRLGERMAGAAAALRGLPINMAFACATVLLDMGVPPSEMALLVLSLMPPMFIGVAHEGAEQASALLRTLPEEHILFRGHPPRTSPRAAARR